MDIYQILEALKGVEENNTGPKFTGYWKGTDAGTPGKKMVGGCAEAAWQ